MTSILLRGGTIITPEGPVDSDVVIMRNRIKYILKRPYEPRLISQMDAKFDREVAISGKLLFPGLIDCHVHFREPGLEQKETMATGSAAALAGGVTTVCEMPNTIPPTVTVVALADKVRRAEKLRINPSTEFIPSAFEGLRTGNEELKIDVRFFFGATKPSHLQALRELWTGASEELQRLKARCCGLKLYFDHSTGNQGADMRVIEEAFKLCAELKIPVVCHCEDARVNQESRSKNKELCIDAHSRIRPPESEVKAIQNALALAKKYDTRLHIAHVSTRGGLELIRAAKQSGITVTCEVAPHHLFLTVEDYVTLGTLAKMNPPLRSREHQEALWKGIEDGTIDCIATDHAPHTLKEKQSGSPLEAPSGVPGVETMLPLLMSVASGQWPHPSPHTTYHIPHTDILRLCFTNPNRIFSLGKQGIAEDASADLILVDPKTEWTIMGKELHSKCGWTPYEGWSVRGKIIQ